MTKPLFILASASPRRVALLKQIGITPDQVMPADIDETPHKGELPTHYAKRIARAKAEAIVAQSPEALVLAADTVVAVGRRILPKAEDAKTARQCLELLSGRRHRVHTAVCIMHAGKKREKLVTTQVSFAPLSAKDIEHYVAIGEWQGKAGGYGIQGQAEAFVKWISGSYSNVVGLPLAETRTMLRSTGV